LNYRDGDVEYHVEVKGIQSPVLAFNVTPKEWWRCETDDAFLILAVTRVLTADDYYIHVLPRDRVASAERIVNGYRIRL
jgi:hypothetical protein